MTTKIMAVLLTVISTVAFAKPNDSTRSDALVRIVAGQANGSYKLIYQGEQGPVDFRLLNQRGKVLHDERFRVETGFIQPINLSQLPSGDYTFVLKTGDETLTEAVTYTSTEDKLASSLGVDQVGQQIVVRGTNPESSELSLYIYDDNNELIHENTITGGQIGQIYELSQVQSKWVRCVISTSNKVVTDKQFDLK